MKTVYETPSFEVTEYHVQEGFLLSTDVPTTTTTIGYDSTEGWSPIRPPQN